MKKLLKRVLGTFGLRISSMVLNFATSIILANTLGAKGFGTYSYVIAWIYFLAVPSTLGFDGLLGREISILEAKQDWKKFGELILKAGTLSLAVSSFLGIAVSLIAFLTYGSSNVETSIAFIIAMLSLPVIAMRKIQRGTMRGLNKIVIGLIPETLLGPIILLATILALIAISWPLKSYEVIAVYSLSLIISTIVGLFACYKSIPSPVSYKKTQTWNFTNELSSAVKWVELALPFMMIEGVHIVNARIDTLMLGAIRGVAEAGIYAPINRGAELTVFVLAAFHGPLAPIIARLFAEENLSKLQETLTKTTKIILIMSGISSGVLILFGQQYLQIFGAEFTSGQNALIIRCAGKFVYSFLGLSPLVLSMTGQARFTAMASLCGAIINVSLNALLIPPLGINGAAIATMISIIIVGVVDTVQVKRAIGVHSSLLGAFSR